MNDKLELKALFKKVSTEINHPVIGKCHIITGYNSDDIISFMSEYMTSRGLFVKNETRINHNCLLPFQHLENVYATMDDGSYLLVYVSVKDVPIRDPDSGDTLNKHYYHIEHSIRSDIGQCKDNILSLQVQDRSYHTTVVFLFQKFNDDLQTTIHNEIQELLPNNSPVSFKNKPYGIQMHTMVANITHEECTKLKKYGGMVSKSGKYSRFIVLRTDSIKNLNRIKLVSPHLFQNVLKVHYGTKLFRIMKDNIDE